MGGRELARQEPSHRRFAAERSTHPNTLLRTAIRLVAQNLVSLTVVLVAGSRGPEYRRSTASNSPGSPWLKKYAFPPTAEAASLSALGRLQMGIGGILDVDHVN